jgi:4'-phosphopantetheinyl transferase
MILLFGKEHFNCHLIDLILKRTKEGKHYFDRIDNARFNVNVSHAGDLVVGACHDRRLVGVDVMDLRYPRNETVEQYLHTMRSSFTRSEFDSIGSGGTDDEKLRTFFALWTLKESYIKALGIGLGFELQRASFEINSAYTSAKITVDGVPQSQWSFQLIEDLHSKHIVAVALGPVAEATPNFRATLNDVSVSDEDLGYLKETNFNWLTVEDILARLKKQ